MNEFLQFPKDRIPKGKTSEHLEAAQAIQVDFGKKAIEKPTKLKLDAMVTAFEIKAYIDGLNGPISNATLAMRNDLVSRYSDSDIIDMIINSSENDWRSRPAFYSALAEKCMNSLRV